VTLHCDLSDQANKSLATT